MASLATTLGLRASSLPNMTTPNYSPAYLGFHFIFAYIILAPRHLKQFHGIDHQESPREDLAKYGDAAVKSGKITQKQLEMMRRNEAAQANSVENYTLFVGAMSFATFAGVERESINSVGLVYTGARVAYGLMYILIDHPVWSVVRSVAWWIGNSSCLWLLWRGKAWLSATSLPSRRDHMHVIMYRRLDPIAYLLNTPGGITIAIDRVFIFEKTWRALLNWTMRD